MANSAIRIPIPGSIIDAPAAQDGDLLYFDSTRGNGGAFTSFTPLIRNMLPDTGDQRLDFYVSVANSSETTSWNQQTLNAMSLVSSAVADNRLGINLGAGLTAPVATLEVGGDFLFWGRQNKAGSMIGSVEFYKPTAGNVPDAATDLVFYTPNTVEAETDIIAKGNLQANGNIFARDSVTRRGYFTTLECLITGGNGIAVSGNSISVVGVSDLASSEGVLVRVDTNTNDVSAFVVSDVTNLDGSPDNIQMLSVSRQHGQLPSVVNGSYVLGNGNDQASNGVKVAIGTGFAGGSRLPCGALLVEDGIQTTNIIDTTITNQNGMGSQVARFARLFGPVAGNPGAVGITGNGNIDSTVRYYDVGLSIDTTSVTGGGRFGYLPALSTITGSGSVVEVDGAYAFPGSFVGAFLNKDQFGGGIRVKACDISNKEFALFLENGTAQIGFDGRQNVWPAAAGDVPNHLYKDWQASDAPVFTVRATSGDTFIRGMLVMPFLPGIQAQASAPSPPGADYFSVITDGTTGVVTLHKLVWNGSAYNSASSYTLPKGTIYADNNGNIKIAKGGSHITNHGLNGVGNWRTCDLA